MKNINTIAENEISNVKVEPTPWRKRLLLIAVACVISAVAVSAVAKGGVLAGIALIVATIGTAVGSLIGWRIARFLALAIGIAVGVLSGLVGNLAHWHAALTAVSAFGAVLLAAWLGDQHRQRRRLLVKTQKSARAKIAAAERNALRGAVDLRHALERELSRSRRYDRPLAVILVTLDPFEGDSPGSPTRETALDALFEARAQAIRTCDYPVDGAEFADAGILLPETPPDGARIVCERLRLLMTERAASGEDASAVTISVGVACFPGDGRTSAQLLDAAQQALAAARERGGNRTLLFRTPEGAPPGWGLHPAAEESRVSR